MDIKVIIEIPEGSAIKYEWDHEDNMITVDRIMPTALRFPFTYGFIPNTLGKDGDPLDVLVLTSQPPVPGVSIKCQVVGMLEMEDEAGIDNKIVCTPLPKVDFICGAWKSLDDVPEHRKNQIRHFFEHYKDLEPGKWVKLNNWLSAEEAIKVVEQSRK
jgi:inorganic pyrophosphatase